ncbi:MAG: glycosyltransferase 87 family protein [Actinomycetota bacterium]|nr:glycosyltransferase 87 family protein [Actinomycetota bacterium]
MSESLTGLVLDSNDVKLYRDTGEALLRGDLPYRDFFIEYPPGGVPAFIPPALFSSELGDFGVIFGTEMAVVLVASLVLVALAARKLRGEWAWVVPALAFTGGTLLLQPVAVTRFDPLVSLSLATAALCAAFGGRYLILAYASLGLGAAAKLVPALATVPLAMLRDRGETVARWLLKTVLGFLAFFATLGVFFIPAYLLGGEQFMESFAYHADRGLQLESLAAAILMKLGWVEEIVFQYGAWEIEGRGVELLSSLSLPISGLLLLFTAAMMYRDHRAQRFVATKFPRYAAAFILAFMIGSKVLSPQYMLWLLPLLPLAVGGLWGVGVSALFLVACWTTTQIFPNYYGNLMRLEPEAVNLLLLRDLLLLMLWAAMFVLPYENDSEEEPA